MEVDYLDPSLRHDPLPMPYRLIDKLVTSIIERTFEAIYLKRRVKAQQSAPPAPSHTLSTERELIFDAEVCISALSPDGKFVFSGGTQGELFCHSLLSFQANVGFETERKRVKVSGEKIKPHTNGPVKCLAVASRKEDLVVGSSAGPNLALHTYEPLGPSDSVFKLACSADLSFPIQSLSLSVDASLLCVSLVDDELIIYAISSSPSTLTTKESWHLSTLVSIRPPALTPPCLYSFPSSNTIQFSIQKIDPPATKDRMSKEKTKLATALPVPGRAKSRGSSPGPGAAPKNPEDAKEAPPIKSPKSTRKNSMQVLPNMAPPPAPTPVSFQAPTVHLLYSPVFGGSSDFVVCAICVWWVNTNILAFYPIAPFSPSSADPPQPTKAARHSFVLHSSISCSCVSPDSSCVVTGLSDGSVIFWNTRAGIVSTGSSSVEGHPGKVVCMCAVDRWLISAGPDGSVHTYEIPTGRLVSRFIMPQKTVEHMVPFAGGKGVMCICTGAEDGPKNSVMACALSLPILQITATFDKSANFSQKPPAVAGTTVVLLGKLSLPLRTSSSLEKTESGEISEDTSSNTNTAIVFDVGNKLPAGNAPPPHAPSFTNFVSLFNTTPLERFRITQQKWTNLKQAMLAYT